MTTGATGQRSGLGEREAEVRLAREPPRPRPAASRSYRSIVVANTFTVFNLVLLAAGVLTLAFGEARDALFLGILVANTAIGIGQEVRAKRALDRLAALVAPTATVVRDGRARTVPVDQVLVDDLVAVDAGDQLVADGTLVEADGLLVDESILTGESVAVERAPADTVRSGSFATDGSGRYVVTAVGADSYAERIAGEARAFRHPRSPLELALNRLLLTLVAAIVPIGGVFVAVLALRHRPLHDAVATAVAGVVSMVPEGLLLLAGLTGAVAALRMARRGVLAQQLNAIESLASVDVLCTDKTGTLTERRAQLDATLPAAGVDERALESLLGRYAASWSGGDETIDAIAAAHPADGEPAERTLAFSSRRRFGGVSLDGRSYFLGAPELFALDGLDAAVRAQVEGGRRVLALGASDRDLEDVDADAGLPGDVRVLGAVVLSEAARPGAADAVAYLRAQDIELKVLSGDAPATVAAIARDLRVADSVAAIDASTLPDEPAALAEMVRKSTVFGRISPEGKRRVVEALRADGRYVGMVGDGVNDVPALKAARLAIAQGTGTQMARAIADLVLVSGDFGVVPPLVREGRQTLRNVQRVAKLFVSKSVFAAVLIVTIGMSALPYPFLPRHLSVSSSLTIGIPGFFLALAPSAGRWDPAAFLRGIARFALPAGAAAAAGVAGAYLLARHALSLPTAASRTVATSVLVIVGLYLVVALEAGSRRRSALVLALCSLMLAAYVTILGVPFARRFFELTWPRPAVVAATVAGALLGAAFATAGLRLSGARGA